MGVWGVWGVLVYGMDTQKCNRTVLSYNRTIEQQSVISAYRTVHIVNIEP